MIYHFNCFYYHQQSWDFEAGVINELLTMYYHFSAGA